MGAAAHNNTEIVSARLDNNTHARQYYEQWRSLPVGSGERELAVNKAFYDLALQNPGAVAWYCALKLETSVHFVQELITHMLQSDTVPGREEAKVTLSA